MAEFINTIDALGEDVVIDSIIDRSITEFKDDTLTFLERYAFHNCTLLKTVDLPNVTQFGGDPSLDNGVFGKCTALETINLPLLKDVYGNYAFSDSKILGTLSLPELENCGGYAFKYCKMTEAVLPKLTDCGQGFFQYCYNLEKVDFSAVTNIGGAFEGCNKFKALIIRTPTVCTRKVDWGLPPTIMTDGTGYIYVPSSLVNSYKNATNWSTVANQFRGIIDDEDALQGIIDETLVNFENNNIELIPHRGFYKYTPIKTVKSTSVTEVGEDAFNGCTALESVDMPNVTSVGARSFINSEALTDVNLPNVVYFGEEAFRYSKLTKAVFPNVTNINAYFVFRDCKSLTEVDFPELVGNYGGLFYGCTKLQRANFPKLTKVTSTMFNSCDALTEVNIPNVTVIEGGAFQNCRLQILDCPKVTAFTGGNTFGKFNGQDILKHLVLRSETICTLENISSIGHFGAVGAVTAIANGTGYIYVPRALIEDYKVATNWSAYATQFRALEDYTVDGTITGKLDETKI